MSRMKTKTLLLLWLFLPAILMGKDLKESAIQESDSISMEEYFNYMGFFAHDSMGGRDVASQGYEYSAEFIVSKLRKFGIEPVGENNSYYQSVPLIQTFVSPGTDSVGYTGKEHYSFTLGENISLLPSTNTSHFNLDAPLVFIGNGIVVPEKQIDPYQDMDVNGKIVIMQMTTPKSYAADSASRAAAQLNRRIERAREKGAAGVILYIPYKMLENLVFKMLHEQIISNFYSIDAENVKKHYFDFGLDFLAFAKYEVLDPIFRENEKSLKKISKTVRKGDNQSFELSGKFSVAYQTKTIDKTSRNIVGMIRGSDPVLRDEYIVLSAHLDHVGIGKAVKGDSIYNGAWDNASGSAGVLTLAHNFSQLPEAPKRSILFIWFTGEEKGLLGSNYFVNYPTVDKNAIKACVNLDMVGNLFDASDFIAMGYDHSNISEAIDFAGTSVGMVRDPSNAVEKKYYTQSDHYSFIEGGIPGVFLWGGFTPVGETKKNEKIYEKWEKKHLHKPSDDMNQDFSEQAMLKALRINFLTTFYLANEIQDITWNTNSTYYKKFVLKEE